MKSLAYAITIILAAFAAGAGMSATFQLNFSSLNGPDPLGLRAAPLPQTQCVTAATAGGTGDAITIPLLPCTPTTTVLELTFSDDNTTSTPTISMNGQTPFVIKNFDGTALTASFLESGQRRLLTFNGSNWFVLSGTGGGTSCAIATDSAIGCVKPDGTTIAVDGGGTVSVTDRPFDVPMFLPGVPSANQVYRVAATRSVSCPSGLSGAVGNSRVAATALTTVNVNQVTAGVVTNRGTLTWTAAGIAATAAGNAFTLSAGDDVEFAFPAIPDATLADIAATLKCSRA